MRIINRIVRWGRMLRLSSAARSVRREGLTYLKPAKLVRIEAELRRLAREGAAGDYIEFGVALGGTAALIAPAAIRSGNRFFGLDVFGMIPPPSSEHDDQKSRQRYADIVSGSATGIGGDTYYGYRDDLYEHVDRVLARYGAPVDGDRVQLVKGLFDETWPALPVEKVTFAHIDCDWHDPVRYCLEAVAPRLAPNGVIVVDDYHDYPGCRVAVDAFLAANPDLRADPGANLVIVRR